MATSALSGSSWARRSCIFASRYDLVRLALATLPPFGIGKWDGLVDRRRLGRLHQAQQHRRNGALRCGARSARQVEMRRTIARAGELRMAAEGDRLVLPVAAIGIAAARGLQIDERHQARADADTTELDRLGTF